MEGTGVAEARTPVPCAGVWSGTLSVVVAGGSWDGNDVLECAAVVRIALIKSILFCVFLGAAPCTLALVGLLCFPDRLARSCSGEGSSPTRLLLGSSANAGSSIGHTNPVRGV
jgi:hypothetical protein